MKDIKKISVWDMPNRVQIPDGYDRKTVPAATKENMEILVDKINELVRLVNELNEKLNS